MTILLNPLLEALDTARHAAGNAVHDDDEMTVEDNGDHWIFEFVPQEDQLGGGARVTITKKDFQILKVVRSQ